MNKEVEHFLAKLSTRRKDYPWLSGGNFALYKTREPNVEVANLFLVACYNVDLARVSRIGVRIVRALADSETSSAKFLRYLHFKRIALLAQPLFNVVVERFLFGGCLAGV